ncbi:MAG: aminomethyl-transferring glycine dehydrogenase subunit GcvPA [Candidatus Gastranaerophilales bacterium]|nr:aminomethyl-transferring glycine dehydrogenase subunit GcvPA [Candidatus Gastranaerophilales bacterium]
MKNFVANPEAIKQQMLEEIGVSSVSDFFEKIPKEARLDGLDLPEGLNEPDTKNLVTLLAKQNNTDLLCFLGGGAYKRYVPACVSEISSRFEFNTAYTPYQPEISQGTLQVIYEFQSMICDLTGMDVSNASVYDAGNACAEAMLMASRITKKDKILVSEAINPEYINVIKTYAHAADIKLEFIPFKNFKTDFKGSEDKIISNDYAAVLAQSPNYFGEIEEMDLLQKIKENSKTLIVACVDLISLMALKKPSEYGADIVVGDIQSLGNPVCFGGPYAGVIATVDKNKRQLPGRIVGRTVDADGKQAFTLTLQAREQHIRREKATSNICSNQALVALNSTVYMSVMGKNGMSQVAYLSAKAAHSLAENLAKKGYKVLSKDFFNEFVLEVEDSDNYLKKLKEAGILGGLKLDDKKILVATTELNNQSQIDLYLENV